MCAHALGLAVILWVLYPVFFHAHVSAPLPGADLVRVLRNEPGTGPLAELARQRPLGPKAPEGAVAAAMADRWLAASRSGGRHPLRFHVDAEDFARDNDMGALPFASLYAADVFVAAFAASGRPEHLDVARQLILGFARYERSAWRAPGLLWNDHAIAARIGVVLRFWDAWRNHASFAESDAAEILQHVARSAALLAKPSHFTAWSNHGVMQNIALLQAAAAFPALVDAASLRRTAFERLQLQWGYYISPEGVVLEHSAGYHAEGLSLLTLATDLLRINGIDAPPEWADRLRRARAFLSSITRPDGTLPAYGDTYLETPAANASRTAAPTTTEISVWPMSGYALVLARDAAGSVASHAVLTWSYFRGQAHKHADEPGLVLWAGGRSWITPSGYAPYSSQQRVSVEGWLGSNAPHAAGEVPDPLRATRLLGSAGGSDWALLDAERSSTGAARGMGFRRQLLQVMGCHWIVIDHAVGATTPIEILWTFLPDLALAPLSAQTYQLRAPDGASMHVRLSSSAAPRAAMHRGSLDPFAGWVATRQGITTSPALRLLSDAAGANSWNAALFTRDGCDEVPALHVDAADRWEASNAAWRLRRNGAQLTFSRAGQAAQPVALIPPPDTTAQRAAAERALAVALDAYPKYRNVDHYRLRMAGWLGALWLALALASFGVHWLAAARRGARAAWQGSVVAGWVVLAMWLKLSYFAA